MPSRHAQRTLPAGKRRPAEAPGVGWLLEVVDVADIAGAGNPDGKPQEDRCEKWTKVSHGFVSFRLTIVRSPVPVLPSTLFCSMSTMTMESSGCMAKVGRGYRGLLIEGGASCGREPQAGFGFGPSCSSSSPPSTSSRW